jgi:S-adenosylmethionine:tRNA ribosyltransferase-isomerase
VKTDLFDYHLPKDLIALHPPDERDGGRLLVLEPDPMRLTHAHVAELAEYLPRDALIVANDTRVIPARLRGHRPTGGAVEVLLIRMIDGDDARCQWSALAKANKPLRPGDRIDLNGVEARVSRRDGQGQIVIEFEAGASVIDHHVASKGEVPLPPYIKRVPIPADRERYQTVYARQPGSIAAPTAGLHLTIPLMDKIRARGGDLVFVTLHVGPGTFKPINSDDLSTHRMDEEHYIIPEHTAGAIQSAKTHGRPVIAVGTTTVRALEGMVAGQGEIRAHAGATELFITPGFEFKVVDGLLTNFHLPRSTLLSLVSALAGREQILTAYDTAVDNKYRFYSYGDAMLILPRPPVVNGSFEP